MTAGGRSPTTHIDKACAASSPTVGVSLPWLSLCGSSVTALTRGGPSVPHGRREDLSCIWAPTTAQNYITDECCFEKVSMDFSRVMHASWSKPTRPLSKKIETWKSRKMKYAWICMVMAADLGANSSPQLQLWTYCEQSLLVMSKSKPHPSTHSVRKRW